MTDHQFWAFIGAVLGGGIPGDVIDVLVWKNVLKAPLSARTRVTILFGTWIILGITFSLLSDNFLKPAALSLGVLAIVLGLMSVIIRGKKQP